MHNSQTSQCDPPQKAKPTHAYDLDHANFREGNYVGGDIYIYVCMYVCIYIYIYIYKDKIIKPRNKMKRPMRGRKKRIQ